MFGGDAAEIVLGGDGDDALLSGGGDDRVFGGFGDDFARLGAGDDLFGWLPGEGNDVVDGEAGTDTLAFDGSGASEAIEVFAEGTAAVLLRDVGVVRMDMTAVERIDLRLFGGRDEVRVADLTGTDLTEIVIDLSGPDGAADLVVIDGTAARDVVTIATDGDAVVVGGLSATIRLLGVEAGLDRLLFRGLGGDDVIDASGALAVGLFVQGGDGDDVVLGGPGDDVLSGDDGDDAIFAGGGDDRLFGGAGDDVLDGGDGRDTLDGGPGENTLLNGEFSPFASALLV